jgi:hypothetical protein
VQFDYNGKIEQIRLHWDQASLLKSLNVIGARSKSWPVRDGKAQIQLMAASIGQQPSTPIEQSRRSTVSTQAGAQGGSMRSHASSITSAMGDPKESLSLFQPREILQTPPGKGTSSGSVSVRASARPPQRDLSEILAGTEREPSIPESPSMRQTSPRKNSNGGAPKAGAGKNYHPIRLFDEDKAAEEAMMSPEKSVKTNPLKYNHFEFGHGEGAGPMKPVATRTKHESQWDFADFVTPQKPAVKVRAQDVRHMDWAKDDDAEGKKASVKMPVIHQARPDAASHFEITDQATTPQPPKHMIGKHRDGMGLYQDNVVVEQPGEGEAAVKQPLQTTVTNVNHGSRHKDFDSQFEIQDQSPPVAAPGAPAPPPQKVEDNRAKVVKGMSANWGLYDESPDGLPGGKENHGVQRYQISAAGDGGMGSRRNAARHWGVDSNGDPMDDGEKPSNKVGSQPKPTSTAEKSFWDF